MLIILYIELVNINESKFQSRVKITDRHEEMSNQVTKLSTKDMFVNCEFYQQKCHSNVGYSKKYRIIIGTLHF